MKHFDRLHDDELQYLDAINRMSRQLHLRDKQQESARPCLQLTVEDLEEQLERLRLDHEARHHHR